MNDKLWLGNLPPDATDEEVLELVAKYSKLEGRVAQHVPGDGTRPGMVIEFTDPPFGAVETVAMRLQDMNWRGHKLVASTMLR